MWRFKSNSLLRTNFSTVVNMNVGKTLWQNLLLLGLILNLVEVISATDYCDTELCPKDTKHIGCKNSGEISRRCEIDAKTIDISDLLKDDIVDLHNQLRNMVAKGALSSFKPAARMATIKWNTELAEIALFSVKECRKKRDFAACLNTAKFKNVGQNQGAMEWPHFDATITVRRIAEDIINTWFKGHEYTSKEDINSFSIAQSERIRHFTQIIQEQTTDIGCAVLEQRNNGMYEQLMTCNYANGNAEGVPVYTTVVEAASQCKTGVNPTYKFLCSRKEKYDMD